MKLVATIVFAAASLLTARSTAAAATTFDSAYLGQSAFVDVQPGATAIFQVFFMNTGTAVWGGGSATQVDLAACLDDKISCDRQDPSEAAWDDGWLSPTRYATTTQVITTPGSIGTFTYRVKAPVATPAGVHHFNGDLVIHASGQRIHPEGYYQDATVQAAAAFVGSVTPSSGDALGGTLVTISGSGFVCAPRPSVSFGATHGFVASCDATMLMAFSPASAIGTAMVTVTNAGSVASNGAPYVFVDATAPILIDARLLANYGDPHLKDVGDAFRITFSEPMRPATGLISPGMSCGGNVSCVWNAGFTALTVTVTVPLSSPLSIPFTIPALDGFSDVAGNAANVAGSLDQLVDIE